MKCEIISSEEIDIIAEVIKNYYGHYAIRKAVSSWYAEIHGKKKLCLRGLPFWTLNFKHNE